jgi:hypothetical protein
MSTNRDDREAGDGREGLERRNFLRGLGLATGTAVAAPVLSSTAEADETPEEQAAKRYQETDHVKRFYALNRL